MYNLALLIYSFNIPRFFENLGGVEIFLPFKGIIIKLASFNSPLEKSFFY